MGFLEKFHSKLEKFHSKPEKFQSKLEKFHSNLEKFHSKLEKFHSTHLLWNDRSPIYTTDVHSISVGHHEKSTRLSLDRSNDWNHFKWTVIEIGRSCEMKVHGSLVDRADFGDTGRYFDLWLIYVMT